MIRRLILRAGEAKSNESRVGLNNRPEVFDELDEATAARMQGLGLAPAQFLHPGREPFQALSDCAVRRRRTPADCIFGAGGGRFPSLRGD
jgi:hypothetical protein